jgi:hypothetical protein
MSDYHPFDFGSWRARKGQGVNCKVHGEQHGGLAIEFVPAPGEAAIRREYCGHCVIAAMDAAMPFLYALDHVADEEPDA